MAVSPDREGCQTGRANQKSGHALHGRGGRSVNPRADASGQSLSGWRREQLLAAAAREHDDPVFTALIALRMLVNKALRGFTGKFGLTSEHLEGIQEKTRRTKRQAAREVLTQYTGG